MSEWPTVRLGDLARWLSGGTPRTSESSYWDGDIPWISASSMKDFFISTSDRNVTPEGAANGTRLVPPGTIIFVVRGMSLMSEFRIGITMKEVAFGQDCKALIPNRDVDPFFLAYAIKAQASRILGLVDAAGHGTGRLQTERIANLRIAIPVGRVEQRRYADVVKSLDDKIAVNDRIADATRALARAKFRAAQDSAAPERVDLASIVEFLNRGIAPHYTEDRSHLRILNQKCVRDGRVSLVPSRRTISEKVSSEKILRVNDVLVNSTGMGTLGRVARWTGQESCTVDSHVSIVRFDPVKIDPVCAGFAMLDAEAEIESLGQGSTGQTELGRVQLSGLRITVPPKERSVQLRPVLDSLENRGDSALAESLSLAQLRDTLLPKLMSGEICVRDAEKIVEDVT